MSAKSETIQREKDYPDPRTLPVQPSWQLPRPQLTLSAEIQLAIEGKSTPIGEGVEYVFTNARHTNPLNRVTPRELTKDRQDLEYDKEKYREMLLEAAETVLGYFGFDRSAYGDMPKMKNRKWWHHLIEERSRDRDIERV